MSDRTGGRAALRLIASGGAAAFLVLTALPAAAAQAPVGLGTADSFAVLAGSGITNTGTTTIAGDVGSHPTPSITGFGSVTLSGTNHGGDSVTAGAKDDLLTAFNDASSRLPVTSVAVELGNTVLPPGVYGAPTLELTGTVTLDAEGDPAAVFIFRADSTLVTASRSRVLLINGASPCNVFWRIGESATFGTQTEFVGNVLAATSITATTNATFVGRLLASNGAVTLDTNTISNAGCRPSTATATSLPVTATTDPPTTTASTATTATATDPTTTAAPSDTTDASAGTPAGPSTTVARATAGDSSRGTPRTTPAPAKPPLAATGPLSDVLVPIGLGLVGLGTVLLRRRPLGGHFRD